MSRKLLPRKLTLVAATPMLLNSILQKEELLIQNLTGADLGITTNSAETNVANCYPVGNLAEFIDHSFSNLYGVSAAGGVIWIFETEQ